MPRAHLAHTARWRAELLQEKAYQAEVVELRVQQWSFVVLLCMTMFIMIGVAPYQHGVILDAQTGATEVSPINRYVWLLLGMMSMPLLLARRHQVLQLMRRTWPLLLLYLWFAMTTQWALDPGVSSRRYFLYVIILLVSMGITLGFSDLRRMHTALAQCCAIMVAIDLVSWALLPGLSMTDLGLAAIHNHKNTLGAVMVFCGAVVAPYIFTQRTARGRFFWSVVFAGALVMEIASKSKTSLALLLAILALMPVTLAVLRLSTRGLGGIVAALVLGLFGALFGWLVYCTALGLDPLQPIRGLTFTKRTDVWAFVITEIVKRPFTGAGFNAFWDINPLIQPSMQTDFWFSSGGEHTNEAHNGYLDLLVTTGFVGLIGALFVLFRWIGRGLGLMRQGLRSDDPDAGRNMAAVTALGIFPTIILGHNFLESSYFTANSMFGTLIVLIGIQIDHAYGALKARPPRAKAVPRRHNIISNSRA